jgi:RNA polymerase primary sigma factor
MPTRILITGLLLCLGFSTNANADAIGKLLFPARGDCEVVADYGSPFSRYLTEISEKALLTADEEKALGKQLKDPSLATEARDHLISANLRLVVYLAKGYQELGLSIEDLIGEGNLGLIRAAQDYDPDFGTRFSTYAGYWIKKSIILALDAQVAPVHIPNYMVEIIVKGDKVAGGLAIRLGHWPSVDEIAAELKLTESETVNYKLALISRELSNVQIGVRDGDPDREMIFEPEFDDALRPEEKATFREELVILRKALNQLRRENRQGEELLRHYFFYDRTQKEAAQEMRLNRNLVPEMFREAKARLGEIILGLRAASPLG